MEAWCKGLLEALCPETFSAKVYNGIMPAIDAAAFVERSKHVPNVLSISTNLFQELIAWETKLCTRMDNIIETYNDVTIACKEWEAGEREIMDLSGTQQLGHSTEALCKAVLEETDIERCKVEHKLWSIVMEEDEDAI